MCSVEFLQLDNKKLEDLSNGKDRSPVMQVSGIFLCIEDSCGEFERFWVFI